MGPTTVETQRLMIDSRDVKNKEEKPGAAAR